MFVHMHCKYVGNMQVATQLSGKLNIMLCKLISGCSVAQYSSFFLNNSVLTNLLLRVFYEKLFNFCRSAIFVSGTQILYLTAR